MPRRVVPSVAINDRPTYTGSSGMSIPSSNVDKKTVGCVRHHGKVPLRNRVGDVMQRRDAAVPEPPAIPRAPEGRGRLVRILIRRPYKDPCKATI